MIGTLAALFAIFLQNQLFWFVDFVFFYYIILSFTDSANKSDDLSWSFFSHESILTELLRNYYKRGKKYNVSIALCN